MARLTHAVLTEFRNHRRLRFEPSPGLTVVSGPNGSGKTNLLEALSLLGPGRGLRHARPEHLVRHGARGWGVAASIENAGRIVELGTGISPAQDAAARDAPAHNVPGQRRIFRLDGETVRGAAAIADLLPVVWFVPQMERLFGEAASGRRRFLDRLVLGLASGHARELASHDSAVQNRNRLLAERRHEAAWLAATEDAITRHAVAIAAARLAICRRLNRPADAMPDPGFPAARLTLVDPVADRLRDSPAREVEGWLAHALRECRADDASKGSTSLGAHRADLAIAEAGSGLDAALASTGQQKSLLLGIVLAHARLVGEDRAAPPLLLLDEPLVHLDERRRAALFARLQETGAQAILTGTDESAFAPIAPLAAMFRSGDAMLRP